MDQCVRRWLDGLAPSTQKSHLPLLKRFFEFAGLEPARAVEFQRGDPLSYRFVDLTYQWFDGSKLGVGTMRLRASLVRGFFQANRVPLPKDKHRFHSEKKPVHCELSVDEFRKVDLASDLTHQAAFLVQFQSGSGVGELLHINTELAGHVWSEVMGGKRFVRLDMPGRKQHRNERPYYTFIGADAIEALKKLFHSRGWRRDTVLFRTIRGAPVSANSLQTYFRNVALRVGLIKAETPPCLECGCGTVKRRVMKKGVRETVYTCVECQSAHSAKDHNVSQHHWGGVRYRMRLHELRDLFRTEFHRAQTYNGADADAAEFFMGHGIDPLKYDKIMHDKKYGLEQYRKAVGFLNVFSEDPRVIERTEIEGELEIRRKREQELTRRLAALERDRETLNLIVERLRDPKKLRRFDKLMSE